MGCSDPSSGSEDSPGPEKVGSVLWHLGLCEADLGTGGAGSFL